MVAYPYLFLFRGHVGLGKVIQLYYTLALTSIHDCSIPLVYVRWKFSETEE